MKAESHSRAQLKALEKVAKAASQCLYHLERAAEVGRSEAGRVAIAKRDDAIRSALLLGCSWRDLISGPGSTGCFSDLYEVEEASLLSRFGPAAEGMLEERRRHRKSRREMDEQDRIRNLLEDFEESYGLSDHEIWSHVQPMIRCLRSSRYVAWNEARGRWQFVTVPIDPLPKRRAWRRPAPLPDDGRKGLRWDFASAQHVADLLDASWGAFPDSGPPDDLKDYADLGAEESLEFWRAADLSSRQWTPGTKAEFWRLVDKLERRLVAALARGADRGELVELLRELQWALSHRSESLARFGGLVLDRKERAAPTCAECH